MYVYEYGVSNFTKTYKPFNHVTVFNDIYDVQDVDENNITGYGFYIKVALDPDDESVARAIVDEKSGGHIVFRARVFEEYLKHINPYYEVGYRIVHDTGINYGPNQQLDAQELGEVKIVSYNGEYYAFIDVNKGLEEVIITYNKESNPVQAKPQNNIVKRLKAAPRFRELEEDLARENISVILMISDDGAKIENTFQNTKTLLPNELVIYVENDNGFNFTGSVFRVRSGNAVTKDSKLPFNVIAKLCRFFDVNISKNKIVEFLTDHVTTKNEEVGYFSRAGLKLIKLASEFALDSVAGLFDLTTQGINYLRIENPNYWKRYDENGNINNEYKPLLPGYEYIKILQAMFDEPPKTKEEKKTKKETEKQLNKNISGESLSSIGGDIEKSEKELRSSIDGLGISSLINFVKQKLQGVFRFLSEVKSIIKKVIKYILDALEKGFIYCNAFIVGLYNSLIDTVTGILQLISMICKGVKSLVNTGAEVLKNPTTYFSMFLEMFENGIETVAKLFSWKNVKAFVGFIVQLVKFYLFPTRENSKFLDDITEKVKNKYNQAKEKISEINTNVSLTYDQLGYGVGYIIGFIVSEVAFTIATGGASTVSTALRVSAKGYLSIIKGAGKIATTAVRGVYKTIKFSFRSVINFMRYLRSLVVKIPQLLKKMVNWFNEMSAVVSKNVDDVFKNLFPSKTARDRITKAGLKPTKVSANGDAITFCPVK
ncbi:hypothetical protein C8N46_106152 [Kordia periserrulae]|uniref:Uncharacterized protein n=1 Tax=Kordia periserrulae TaxID=701523 RepID=A0A2T6BX26_9FLAO|nr:hypothetical protein [Kordia periserrulae]PTX60507.1 hypothetical protein C8N46_106152 [Kordia periserrulae]